MCIDSKSERYIYVYAHTHTDSHKCICTRAHTVKLNDLVKVELKTNLGVHKKGLHLRV